MQNRSYSLTKDEDNKCLVIEVSRELEKMVQQAILELGLKTQSVKIDETIKNGQYLKTFKIYNIPFSRTSEFAWYMANWYSKNYALINFSLN